MTERQNAIFYFFNLIKQAREWSYGIEIDKIEDKYLKNKILESKKANDKLIQHIELRLSKSKDKDYMEQFWNDSEQFSQILEFLRKEPDLEKKQQLFIIINEFVTGKLTIVEDGRSITN